MALLRAATTALLMSAVLLVGSLGLVQASPAQAAVTHTIKMKLRLEIWHWALHQKGKPYIWGGTGPHGFDCSGLVYASYRHHGVKLPRTTTEMLGNWHLKRISKRQARRGDLAFFGSGHVELYDRGNWTFGAAHPGTRIGYHRMNAYWHPTMYFRIRRA
jgi:cell wall-associated NlpC family hydrolase